MQPLVNDTTGTTPHQRRESSPSDFSCGLQGVQLKHVVIGRGGEEELVMRRRGRAVVTGAVEAQRPLKVQELAHEVEVRGDVGLFPLDEVVRVVERQVELLHQVGHRDGHRSADPGQTVHEDAALFGASLI